MAEAILNETEQELENGLQEGQETAEEVTEDDALIGLDEEEPGEETEEEAKEETEQAEDEPVRNNPVREQRIALREKDKALKAKDREILELRQKLDGGKKVEEDDDVLPPEPVLKDFEWVEEDYSKAHKAWLLKSIELGKKEEAKKEEIAKIFENYQRSVKELNLSNFKEYADDVSAVLSKSQQDAILAGCNDPARIVATLGKNPKRLEALAKMGSSVKFAVALGNLEKEISMTKRSSSTKAPPEKPLSGGGGGGGGGFQARLDLARAKADKTGDRTEVVRLMKQQKEQGK